MKLGPPVSLVKGLQVLQKDLYVQKFMVPAARLTAKNVGLLRSKLPKDFILQWPRVKTVLLDPKGDPQLRLLLLNPEKIVVPELQSETKNELKFIEQSEADEKEAVKELWIEFDPELIAHELILDYEHWSTEEILSATLPDGMDVPGSFETVGHIAHLNLRDEHQPYKNLIGTVILDKNPHIRTVVNKVGAIDTTFRFFKMEVLAGVEDMTVEVKEEGCYFNFDYSKVYWNSRLQYEHRRLVEGFKRGERVCDMFCGVGPFAIPAAKRNIIVYANDLNPESIKYLTLNKSRNKITDKNLHIYNMDAREFVPKALADLNIGKESSESYTEFFDHYVMNLPASAHEFLDAFGPLMRNPNLPPKKARVHCYVFCKPEASPVELVEQYLKATPVDPDAHFVRNVAPNKDMYCVSFYLPNLTDDIGKRPKLE